MDCLLRFSGHHDVGESADWREIRDYHSSFWPSIAPVRLLIDSSEKELVKRQKRGTFLSYLHARRRRNRKRNGDHLLPGSPSLIRACVTAYAQLATMR